MTPPYVASGIAPFRMHHFTNEFNYTGWHNFDMQDYAATHGFDAVAPYVRDRDAWNNLPTDTIRLHWGTFVHWEGWMAEHGIPAHRYDLLADRDLVSELKPAAAEWYNGSLLAMLDLEHALPAPQQVDGYPHDGDDAERAKWRQNYYDGYAATLVATAKAVRLDGAPSIGIYGWQPFRKTWFGLEDAVVDPATYWEWHAFGRKIYDAYDVMHPDVYCFYFDPANVAFTLANVDLCRKLIESEPVRKPMRPYYWTLLHGGDAKYHWWKDQPIYNEEARARTTLAFFAGIDGIVEWNWSDLGSHIKPPPIEPGRDVMVGHAFDATTDDGRTATIKRYDIVRIIAVSDGRVHLRRHLRGLQDLPPDAPSFVVDRALLQSHLRPAAGAIAAVIEGLALVKPLEYILRHGEVAVDVSAQRQFAEHLPIVRRVTLDGLHVMATYDPGCVYGGEPRDIVLADFAGRHGMTLTLPADAQVRLFVVRDPR
jgi:hypothetical protein